MPPLSRGLRVPGAAGLSVRTTLILPRRYFGSRNDFFKVSEEVRDALQNRKPVVALETTIYTHGFPYPENVALSSHLESLVRVNGGVPATIGILDGVARVGMQPEELIELISKAGQSDVMKVSRRDLGYLLGLGLTGKKLHGGTTIAGTVILAHLAGIKVFATGGLGGVHRGGENSLDISADLTELGRTPVAVISAGCKSFLDIPRTLEYLETQGVGVGTFADGRQGAVDLPAFYVRDSGIKSPRTITDEKEAAAIIYAQSRLPVHSGLWFGGPVPAKDSLTKEEVDDWVKVAIDEAERNGACGAANTPYVLDKIKQLSGGRSVTANRASIVANVVRGTKVAVELAELELREQGILDRNHTTLSSAPRAIAPSKVSEESCESLSTGASQPEHGRFDLLVAGALAADLICEYAPLEAFADASTLLLNTSNPAIFSHSVGGVGHNVALAAHYAGASTLLCSAVGNDVTGRALIEQIREEGLETSGVDVLNLAPDARTAEYVAIADTKKDLVVAMADMSILSNSVLDAKSFWAPLIARHQPKWVIVDGNWSTSIISHIAEAARSTGANVAFEPVSAQKSTRLIHLIGAGSGVPNQLVDLATPNIVELQAMYNVAREALLFESEHWWSIINALDLSRSGSRDRFINITDSNLVDQGVPQQTLQLLPFIPCMVTKLGHRGCLLSQLLPPEDSRLRNPEYAPFILGRSSEDKGAVGGVYMRLFPPAELVKQADVASVNGVGDTLLGVLVAGLASRGSASHVEDMLMVAQEAAVRTLKSAEAVSKDVRGILGQLG